jgi:hypothetical protein
MFEIGVASSGIASMQDFMEICQLIQKGEGDIQSNLSTVPPLHSTKPQNRNSLCNHHHHHHLSSIRPSGLLRFHAIAC